MVPSKESEYATKQDLLAWVKASSEARDQICDLMGRLLGVIESSHERLSSIDQRLGSVEERLSSLEQSHLEIGKRLRGLEILFDKVVSEE